MWIETTFKGVVSIWISLSKKMAERGRVWSDEEIRCLLALWSDAAIQHELLGSYREETEWKKLTEK